MKAIGWLILTIFILLVYSIGITSKLIKSKPQIITHSDTIKGDSIFTTKIVYLSKPYKVEFHDTVYKFIDSTQCIEDYEKLYKEYASIKFTRDTLQNDSSATIIVGTKVGKNTLDSLGLSFKNNRIKVINNTTVIYNNRSGISAGLIVGNKLVAPSISLNYFKKFDVGAGWNLYNNSIVLELKYRLFGK